MATIKEYTDLSQSKKLVVEYCTKFKSEVSNIYNLNGCIECTLSNNRKKCIYKRVYPR